MTHDARHYCENCAHFLPSNHEGKSGVRFGKCRKAREAGNLGIEFVAPNMESEITYQYASCVRVSSAPDSCGPEARWFEPRPAPEAHKDAAE